MMKRDYSQSAQVDEKQGASTQLILSKINLVVVIVGAALFL